MTSWFGVTCLRCGLMALHSVVAGSISNGGDHGIHCWWDLIRSKPLSSVSVCCSQVFAGFSSNGNSIHNIIPLLKKENIQPCRWVLNLLIVTPLVGKTPPIKRVSWVWRKTIYDGEAPVLQIWEVWNTTSLSLLSCQPRPGVVGLVRV